MQRARGKGNRNNRRNYLRAPRSEETGGNEIEGEEEVGGEGGGGERERQSAALSSRLFNYLSCSRTSLLCRARIRQRCDFANYSG